MRRLTYLVRRIRSEPKPWRFVLSRILWHSRLCRLVVIDLGYARLHFAPTALSAQLWLDPLRREADTAFFKSVLRPGDVVADVGANVGTLTILASRLVGPAGHVLALEPNPNTYRFLLRNLTLNHARNVTAVRAAAGAADGTGGLIAGRSDDQDRIGEGGMEVPVRSLDSLLATDVRPIRLLKIDVEGFEKAVLEGAPQLLRRTRFVYFETGDELSLRYGYSTLDLVEYVRAMGFDVLVPTDRADLVPVDATFDTAHPGNLVARSRLP